jgi:hypothetical protein
MTVSTGRDDDYFAFKERVFGTVAKPGRFNVYGGRDNLDAGLLGTVFARNIQHLERLHVLKVEDVIT